LEDRASHLLERQVGVCPEGYIDRVVGPYPRRADFVGRDLGPLVRVEGVSDRIVGLDLVGPFSGLVVVAGRIVAAVNPIPPDMYQAYHPCLLLWDRGGDIVQTITVDRRVFLDCTLVVMADLVDHTRHWGRGNHYFEKVGLAGHVVVEISVLVQVLDRRAVVEEVDHQDGVSSRPGVAVALHVHSSSVVEDLSYHHNVHDLTAGEEVYFGPNFVDHRVVQTLFEEVNQS